MEKISVLLVFKKRKKGAGTSITTLLKKIKNTTFIDFIT